MPPAVAVNVALVSVPSLIVPAVEVEKMSCGGLDGNVNPSDDAAIVNDWAPALSFSIVPPLIAREASPGLPGLLVDVNEKVKSTPPRVPM